MTVHPQYFVWTSKQQFHFIIYLTDKSKQKTSESLWYFGLVMIHLLHCILCSTCITIGPGQRWAENQTGEKKRIYNSRNYGGCQMLRILFIFLFVVLLSRFFNASGHYDATCSYLKFFEVTHLQFKYEIGHSFLVALLEKILQNKPSYDWIADFCPCTSHVMHQLVNITWKTA